ncbi:MAG TPA: DUF2157 domain-containing protein [Thermoanaerobaculia bacterium]|nr:DUF2157 domain-containing protein [Thermoanaerobaculia bacterium]
MFSLRPELERLRPLLGESRTDALIARERREIFSIYPEVRLAAWAGVMLLAGAAGVLLKNNLERIGPVALATGIAVLAAACYAFVTWRRDRATLVDDYVLLLGALLLSADVAFIETQFHVLGQQWRQHLLLIAILHAITAYRFRSRVILSLAISSLAAWVGADHRIARPYQFGVAAYVMVALLLVWRALDQRFAKSDFARTLEHFAANFALLGGLAFIDTNVAAGCLITIVVAAVVIYWGFGSRSEWFVLYAFLYAVIALNILIIDAMHFEAAAFLLIIVSIVGSIIGLFAIHAKFKELHA